MLSKSLSKIVCGAFALSFFVDNVLLPTFSQCCNVVSMYVS